MRIVISIFVIVFTALVMVAAVVFLVMEATDKLESLRKKAPWFVILIEKRESLNVLFVVCAFLLLGNGYELVVKEIPEVPAPPVVKIMPPVPPQIVNPPASLTRPQSKPPERSPSSQTASQPTAPPPILVGIRIASQKRIPSDDTKFPYGLEVVIQTDTDIEPVALAVICDGPIGKGDGGFANGGAYTMTKQGLAKDHENVFIAEWKSPAWTAQAPIVMHLFSEHPIKATSAARINYIWP